eukprot:jgi/Chrpa1/21974/Chrysochromulina_OHIO_Genome00025378-RA
MRDLRRKVAELRALSSIGIGAITDVTNDTVQNKRDQLEGHRLEMLKLEQERDALLQQLKGLNINQPGVRPQREGAASAGASGSQLAQPTQPAQPALSTQPTQSTQSTQPCSSSAVANNDSNYDDEDDQDFDGLNDALHYAWDGGLAESESQDMDVEEEEKGEEEEEESDDADWSSKSGSDDD